jgi:uncharacterized protein
LPFFSKIAYFNHESAQREIKLNGKNASIISESIQIYSLKTSFSFKSDKKMTLEQQITEDLKTAMRAKDEVALRAIRAIKAAILVVKTDGSGTEIDEAKSVQIVQKLVKQRRESLEIFEREKREDLASKEREEIAVLEKYLPKMMDESEVTLVLQAIIASVGATSGKDLGKVMGAATKQLAGKADGKLISEVAKKLLS